MYALFTIANRLYFASPSWLFTALGKLADCAFSMYSIAEDLIALKSVNSNNFLSWQCSQTEDGHVIIKPLMVNIAELDSVTVASHTSTFQWRRLRVMSGAHFGTVMLRPQFSNAFALCCDPNAGYRLVLSPVAASSSTLLQYFTFTTS